MINTSKSDQNTELMEEDIVLEQRPAFTCQPPPYSFSYTSLPCCSMVQFNIGGNPTKEIIWARIKEQINSQHGNRRVMMAVVVMPNEQKLFNTLKEVGFKEVAEFSRRHRYDQSQRLKMLLFEPETVQGDYLVKNAEGIVENKIILPNN